MTTITIYKSNANEYKGFQCFGHAGYADYGKDIICSAISVLVINTINSIEELAGVKDSIVDMNEKTGDIKYQLGSIPNEFTTLLLDLMVLGLTKIKEEYGNKYLKLKFEEV